MRMLCFLLAGAAALLADEPQADPATSHLPADAFVVVRLAPPERFDVVGRELPVLGQVFEDRSSLGEFFVKRMTNGVAVDRSHPIYWAIGPSGSVTLLRAASGTTREELAAAGKGCGGERADLLEDGWIRVWEGAAPAEAGAPVALLPGDVSLTVPVGRLVRRHRATLAEAIESLDGLDDLAREQGVPLPQGLLKLVRMLSKKLVASVSDVTDLHYALGWRNGKLESEGWVRTVERSPLSLWLESRRGGKPNELMGFLPARALYMVESNGVAATLDADIGALLDEAFGAGAGASLLLLLSPGYALHEHLTGQAAGAIVLQGMMAMGMTAIHEVRPRAPIAEAIAAIDTPRLNRLLAGAGVPVEVKFEPNFAQVGETAIHRLTFASPEPTIAMFGIQMATCFAVEEGRLLVAQSSLAESDLRALILRIRASDRSEHPHSKAMNRLMPDRHEGLSVNLGALKPVLAMFAMAVPEGARIMNAIPDDLWLSTALAVRGGHLHFRGDWPLKEFLALASTLNRELR